MKFKKFKNLDELLKTASDKITEEMIEFFNKRTKKHIDLVRKYCTKIYELDKKNFKEILELGEEHDNSKWKSPERDPYIFTTWDYKCKDDGVYPNISEEMRNKMNEATNHHVKNNEHHPEYWSNTEINVININNRDSWEEEDAIDSTKMPLEHVACMVADWCAMSEEKGSNPYDWAKDNINKRWGFTKEQTEFIYDILNNIWNT